MAARLGEVLFWTGCIIATLTVLTGAVLFSGTRGADLLAYSGLTLSVAALVFLAGRAARYVLAGR